MENEEREFRITSLTKDEYETLSMIFTIGVAKFIDNTNLFNNVTKETFGSDIFEKYQSDKLDIIYDLADKFNFDF